MRPRGRMNQMNSIPETDIKVVDELWLQLNGVFPAGEGDAEKNEADIRGEKCLHTPRHLWRSVLRHSMR